MLPFLTKSKPQYLYIFATLFIVLASAFKNTDMYYLFATVGFVLFIAALIKYFRTEKAK